MRKGGDPVLVENTDADIIVANPSVNKATALDINGQPLDIEVSTKRDGGKLLVKLPPGSLYTILSAE